jgi:hypothetical protein
MGSISNVKIEPMSVTWGDNIPQVVKITTVADVSSSLNNKYFFLYSPTVKYHVWLNIGAAGTNPAPAGSTAIEVTAAADATDAAIATAVQTAVDAHASFTATVSGNKVTITNVTNGYAPASHEGNAGFAHELVTQGFAAYEIGCVDGDIELSFAEDLAEITCHDSGTSIVGHLVTGKTVSVTVSFKETNKDNLKKLLVQSGGSYIPVGASSTEVAGMGTSKLFKNTYAAAMKVTLHPKRLPTGDKTEDWTFWKAYSQLESLVFSGENIMTVPVTFNCYPDSTKHAAIQYFAYGDTTNV